MKSVEPPDLDHDKMMHERFGTKVSPDGRLMRRIVANLVAHLAHHEFAVLGVYDGEVKTRVTNVKEAMELIFNLDESWLHFKKHEGHRHSVWLILENGIDIISDYSVLRDDADGFDKAMQEFDPEQYA